VITQQKWIRFVLTSVSNNLDQVKGTDVDSGRPVMARLSDLHYLPRSHSVLSTHPLALPCCLHGVESTHRQGWWPPDSQLLWKLTREKVHAVFRGHPCPPPAACCVELYLDDRRSKNIAEILQSSGTYVSFTSQFLEEDDQLVDQLESMGMVESGFHVNTPCGSHDPGNITQLPGHMTQLPGNITQLPGHMTQLPSHMTQIRGHMTLIAHHMTGTKCLHWVVSCWPFTTNRAGVLDVGT
jgi:hypothetical protein